MTQIIVVNKRIHKPTRNDFYIGRPSPLGNPFTHIADKKTLAHRIVGSREEAIEAYQEYFKEEIRNSNSTVSHEFDRLERFVQDRDIVYLVCWCAPKGCHGDVLKAELERIKGVENA